MESGTAVTIFAGVVAATLVVQVLALLAVVTTLKNLSARIEHIRSTFESEFGPLSSKVVDMVDTIRTTVEKVQVLQENLTATSEVVHKRVVELDAFVAETTDAARLQIIRLQDLLDTAGRRIEHSIELVHNGILKPVTEVTAVVRGVQVGVNYILRHRRRDQSGPASPDEEMFI
jgi:methyl-accepting chemotaxis protein